MTGAQNPTPPPVRKEPSLFGSIGLALAIFCWGMFLYWTAKPPG